jgi:hypothetical protein
MAQMLPAVLLPIIPKVVDRIQVAIIPVVAATAVSRMVRHEAANRVSSFPMATLNNPALLRMMGVELPGETAKTGALAGIDSSSPRA